MDLIDPWPRPDPESVARGEAFLGKLREFATTRIDGAQILKLLDLTEKRYFLVTLHRAENVDLPDRMTGFAEAFRALSRAFGLPR